MRYRVTAPYVTCHSASAAAASVPAGFRYGGSISPLIGFYTGALLPEDVPAEDIVNLLRDGLIVAEEPGAGG